MSCHVMSCVMSYHVLSYHVVSCIMSCTVHIHTLDSCHVMSCHVTSRLVMILQSLAPESFSRAFLNSSIRAAGGFRNRGPVRESGSERRSRCGAACIATVPRGRRGEWCELGIVLRGRLRGSGVFEVCRGHVAGVPRRRAVGIGFGSCCVHV